MRRTLALVAGLIALPALAQADTSLLATLNACKAVPEAAARLACYDAALGRTAAPAAPAASPAAAAAPVTPPTADFGLNQPRPETVVQQIESRIGGRFEGWEPGTRWTLANGQVWEVADSSRTAYDLTAPAVRVKRGALGSFFMEIDGVAATPRVRRIK